MWASPQLCQVRGYRSGLRNSHLARVRHHAGEWALPCTRRRGRRSRCGVSRRRGLSDRLPGLDRACEVQAGTDGAGARNRQRRGHGDPSDCPPPGGVASDLDRQHARESRAGSRGRLRLFADRSRPFSDGFRLYTPQPPPCWFPTGHPNHQRSNRGGRLSLGRCQNPFCQGEWRVDRSNHPLVGQLSH